MRVRQRVVQLALVRGKEDAVELVAQGDVKGGPLRGTRRGRGHQCASRAGGRGCHVWTMSWRLIVVKHQASHVCRGHSRVLGDGFHKGRVRPHHGPGPVVSVLPAVLGRELRALHGAREVFLPFKNESFAAGMDGPTTPGLFLLPPT